MVIPDLNLIVYAYNRAAAEHVAAKAWWERLLSGEEAVAMPWIVIVGFLRLATHRSVLREPVPVAECLSIVDEWFEAPNMRFLEPGPRHWPILSELLRGLQVGGILVTDAHLAALAIEHNAELHSNDADFTRFSGLRWVNPLKPRR